MDYFVYIIGLIFLDDKGDLCAFKITRGNRSDSKQAFGLLKTLQGLAFGDKGYLGKKLFEELFSSGLKLITRKRKNMKKTTILSAYEKQLLNQRGIVETLHFIFLDNLKFTDETGISNEVKRFS
jgi:hypothetical protein